MAGTFYPADPDELTRMVDDLLARAAPPADPGRLVALVVPHAGYVYSGPVAATTYALLRGRGRARIAMFGPSHFVPVPRGADAWMAVPEVDGWRTPLGIVPIDAELRALSLERGVTLDDRPHGPEHSLEVQLPFLQRVAGSDVSVLPVAVGTAPPRTVAALMAALAPLALVLVSTDLSHYHDDATARELDRRTAAAFVDRDPTGIRSEDACGSYALRGLAELARREDLCVHLLDLRTSAETAGDPWRVVGYGAFAVTPG